ncbi:MAG: serine protein kinase RIO [Candidatus Nanohaloarchaea archaeon]
MGNERFDHRRWEEESRRMFDSSEAKKSFENVFDSYTKKQLLKLSDERALSRLYGAIESGKESQVFLADTPDGERVAVKIYMTRAGSFREMEDYLRGDQRFEDFKSDRRSVIEKWCRKEYRNLEKARNVLKCPEPVTTQGNILVMEFLGREFSPFPKLKNVEIENPQTGWEKTRDRIRRLWEQEKLVHGDLSEYNILVTDEPELAWIDFSQGVHRTHPRGKELLERDLGNIADFFDARGAEIGSISLN